MHFLVADIEFASFNIFHLYVTLYFNEQWENLTAEYFHFASPSCSLKLSVHVTYIYAINASTVTIFALSR